MPCIHLLFPSWHNWGCVPSLSWPVKCDFDSCQLQRTMPFHCLISLFYINLSLSTGFFLSAFKHALLFPILQNIPEKCSLGSLLSSKNLSISLPFLLLNLLRVLSPGNTLTFLIHISPTLLLFLFSLPLGNCSSHGYQWQSSCWT